MSLQHWASDDVMAGNLDGEAGREPSRGAPGKRALTDRLVSPATIARAVRQAARDGAQNADGAAAGGPAAAGPATGAGATAGADAAGVLVADDGAPAPGQMRRSDFMQQLREAVTLASAATMGAGWTPESCPHIEQWFRAHGAAPPATLEAIARRYSGLNAARTAQEYIPAICARLGRSILQYQAGGDVAADLAVAGVPAQAVPPLGAAAGGAAAGGDLGAGAPLDSGTAARMSEAFGENLEHVRIHDGPDAARLAGERSAQAFTVGRDIVFGAGRYRPGTPAGDALLAHELAHVQQQRAATAGVARPSLAAVPSEVDHNSEDAADDAAVGVVARLHGGAETAKDGAKDGAGRAGSAVTSPMRLQRCQNNGNQVPPGAAITIPGIAYNGSANRLPPGQSTTVAVAISGLPSGQRVDLDVENSGTASGSATITAGQQLTAGGNVTLLGGTQTTPGSANTLRLRARVGGTTVGTSPGFTVAAWPRDFTTALISDLDDGTRLGLRARNDWTSDGSGGKADLTEADRSELVGLGSRDNPPFTSAGGTSTTSGTSGYLAGTSGATTDTHSYGRSSINTTGLAHGVYTIVYTQLFVLRCRRTGVNDIAVPNSGFTITHTARWNGGTSAWNHDCVKTAAATTVGAFSSAPGGGPGGTSSVHVL